MLTLLVALAAFGGGALGGICAVVAALWVMSDDAAPVLLHELHAKVDVGLDELHGRLDHLAAMRTFGPHGPVK